ncbi:MAG: ABC transporter permease [Christensenellaceae bacterium]|nr:ABC transporter permease [Christensenellaceae bacterium]
MNKREPLIRVVGRAERVGKQRVLLTVGAIVLALAFGAVFLLIMGYNPLQVYATILSGAFRSKLAREGTVKVMIPLVISTLGVTLAFKMRFWNIGAEGQIIMGAAFASYFALYCAHWNHWVLILVMFLAGAIGGGLWGLIAAAFKIRWGTNETLLTLMMNYIAQHIVSYLRDGPWKDPEAAGFSKIARFDSNAALDKVLGVHFGWIIAIVLAVIVFVYLKYTKQGYEISVVGESHETARYAGMNIKKITLRTMFLSGAVCGICGMVQATGADVTLTTNVAGGVGFTAIIIAWLGNLNPFISMGIAGAFSILEKGSTVVQSSYGLSADCADVLQGIILFFVVASEFFVRYRFVLRNHKEAK